VPRHLSKDASRWGTGHHGPVSDLVVAANRAPVTFKFDDAGTPQSHRGGGGMITIASALGDRGASWVAAAMTDADRRVAEQGGVDVNGLEVDFLPFSEDVYASSYDTIANATLWFVHHGLFDRARQPVFDRDWWSAWGAFREYNAAFAERVADVAGEGAIVLVQDYHLCLVGAQLAAKRPDLRLVHFSHTPFAAPDALRVMPDQVVGEVLEGMLGFKACGFHSERWAANFRSACEAVSGPCAASLFVAPLVPSADDMAELARSEAGQEAHSWLDERLGDRKMLLRVDRIELSKNLLRGFQAYDELMATSPELRGQVVFFALVYASRENLESYLSYRQEVERLVDDINVRWGTDEWTPIVFDPSDSPARSAAALTRYDALLVNPLRDGLNLVAMEGPVLNRTDGVLVLSREAGAWDNLSSAAIGVNPFDVSGTAEALASALGMPEEERSRRAENLKRVALSRTPNDWLADLIEAAG
jgi:trehalose 6-phosphate synthase